MLPGAAGVAICALLVFGAVYTETTTVPGLEVTDMQPTPPPPSRDPAFALNQSDPSAMPVAFTNASQVIGLSGSLFDQARITPRPVYGSSPLIPFAPN